MKKDLFGEVVEEKVEVNIYADEIQPVRCPYTGDEWFYIGIIVENVAKPILDKIIKIRYRGNFDTTSPYFEKNDRIVHWSEICDIDTKNIAKRWIEFIIDPSNKDIFFAYVLGINKFRLNKEAFDPSDEFNSQYNRFFRTAVLYGLNCFFPQKRIIVKNIFHEAGQQMYHKFFPWHCIYKISQIEENIEFIDKKIQFLPKSHREDKRSNLIQLCDVFLGLCKTLLHGIDLHGKSYEYKKELLELFLPLFKRMINEPQNFNSSYVHANRIMIRFFPKDSIKISDIRTFHNQFYTKREIKYVEDQSNQYQLCFDF